MEKVGRKQAKEQGLVKYFTGSVCPRGHISYRYVSTGGCCECCAQRAKDPTNLARLLKWRESNPETSAEAIRVYREKNRFSLREKGMKYYWDNRDICLERSRQYSNKNREKVASRVKQWRENNRESRVASEAKRRARKRMAAGSFDRDDVLGLIEKQDRRCVYCRSDITAGYHVDHVMPLALGGSNDLSNLQVLCPTCNLSKGALHPAEYEIRIGFCKRR